MPVSNPATILIGEPVIKDLDIGRAIYDGKPVEANVFSGSSVLEPGTPTGEVKAVKQLLSPLASREVGTIRCIGLNVCVSF